MQSVDVERRCRGPPAGAPLARAGHPVPAGARAVVQRPAVGRGGRPLAAAGHPVYAVDLRSHGESDAPEPGYDTATAAADLAALCADAGPAPAGGGRPVVGRQRGGPAGRPAPGAASAALALVDGGWIDLSAAFATWEECADALRPPDVDGRRRRRLRGSTCARATRLVARPRSRRRWPTCASTPTAPCGGGCRSTAPHADRAQHVGRPARGATCPTIDGAGAAAAGASPARGRRRAAAPVAKAAACAARRAVARVRRRRPRPARPAPRPSLATCSTWRRVTGSGRGGDGAEAADCWSSWGPARPRRRWSSRTGPSSSGCGDAAGRAARHAVRVPVQRRRHLAPGRWATSRRASGATVDVGARWRTAPPPGLARERALAALRDGGLGLRRAGLADVRPAPVARHPGAAARWSTCWPATACVLFASAAALTLGSHTMPVYEIYKAGIDPHWVPGLEPGRAA